VIGLGYGLGLGSILACDFWVDDIYLLWTPLYWYRFDWSHHRPLWPTTV